MAGRCAFDLNGRFGDSRWRADCLLGKKFNRHGWRTKFATPSMAYGGGARLSAIVLVLLSFFGPISGPIGFFYVVHFPQLVGGLMILASGGILYLIFQDIAPQAKQKNRFSPARRALHGLLLGLIGKMTIVDWESPPKTNR